MIEKIIILFIVLCYSCNSNPSNDSGQIDKVASVEVPTNSDHISNGQQSENVKEEYLSLVKDFISLVENNDIKKLAEKVSYPLKRENPIPPVENSEAFSNQFNEIFDDELIKIIVESDPVKDWSAVGWRGLMLKQGDIWLSHEGQLIAVNYQSDFEKQQKARLISEEKSSLHSSIENFSKPSVILKSESYQIRIDEMKDGQYRYASWKVNSKMSEKPDIILKNGKVIFEGSGGNHYYEFINNNYKYICQIYRMGEDDTPPARLIVFENGVDIISQECDIIKD